MQNYTAGFGCYSAVSWGCSSFTDSSFSASTGYSCFSSSTFGSTMGSSRLEGYCLTDSCLTDSCLTERLESYLILPALTDRFESGLIERLDGAFSDSSSTGMDLWVLSELSDFWERWADLIEACDLWDALTFEKNGSFCSSSAGFSEGCF